MKNQQNDWLSVHLYLHEPMEKYLADVIYPFVTSQKDQNFINQFFFIRYWQSGPHLRLRFKCKESILKETVRSNIAKYFSNFKQLKVKEDTMYNQSRPHFKFPPYSLLFVEYEPETVRYGGKLGLQISELLFEATSLVVMNALQDKTNWGYARRVAIGLQLQLGFAYSFDMNKVEAYCFFKYLSKSYLLPSNFGDKLNVSQKICYSDKVLTKFKTLLEKQKNILFPSIQFLWQELNSENALLDEWYNEWIIRLGVIKRHYFDAFDSNKIEIPAFYKFDEKIPVSSKKQKMWTIYISYIHMINNRLGIANQDESYICYLIYRYFRQH